MQPALAVAAGQRQGLLRELRDPCFEPPERERGCAGRGERPEQQQERQQEPQPTNTVDPQDLWRGANGIAFAVAKADE